MEKEYIKYVNSFKNGIATSASQKLKSPADEESIKTAIDLAYNDAKRTMKGINSESRDNAKKALCKEFVRFFKMSAPEDEDSFDNTHDDMCVCWMNHFSGDLKKYGKAQKIVNMTFKYLYCCENAEDYERHFQHCHMPLDSFTLEWFWRNIGEEDKTVLKGKMSSWSSLDNCKKEKKTIEIDGKYTYNFYVGKIRKHKDPENPDFTLLQLEFKIWPEIQKHLAAEAFILELKRDDNLQNKERADIKKLSLEEKLDIIKKIIDNSK